MFDRVLRMTFRSSIITSFLMLLSASFLHSAGLDVNVSKQCWPTGNPPDRAYNEAEIWMASDPTNDQNIVALGHAPVNFEKQRITFTYSRDAGKHWRLINVTDPFGTRRRFDPTISYGGRDTVYIAYGVGEVYGPRWIVCQRYVFSETQDAFVFNKSRIVIYENKNDAEAGTLDKFMITTGPDPNNLSRTNIYLTYSVEYPEASGNWEVAVARTTSTKFTDPTLEYWWDVWSFTQISSSSYYDTFSMPAVDPLGILYVVWDERTQPYTNLQNGYSTLKIARSNDGGVEFLENPSSTLGKEWIIGYSNVTWDETQRARPFTIPPQPKRGIWSNIGIAVDRSTLHSGRIYVTYVNTSTHWLNSDTNVYVDFLDPGSSWENSTLEWAGATIVHTTTAGNQFLPSLSVDPYTGIAVVSWLDSRPAGDPVDDGQAVDLYIASSSDGILWNEVKLSDLPSNQGVTNCNYTDGNPDGQCYQRNFLEYTGLSVMNGTAYAIFPSNRDDHLNDPLATKSNLDYYCDSHIVGPRILNVPGRFGSPAQALLDQDTKAGDIILVTEFGTHTDQIVMKSGVSLVAANNITPIIATGQSTAVLFPTDSSPFTLVRGFDIRGGGSEVCILRGAGRLENCSIKSSSGTAQVGVRMSSGTPVMAQCSVENCSTAVIAETSGSIDGCTLVGANTDFGDGLRVDSGSPVAANSYIRRFYNGVLVNTGAAGNIYDCDVQETRNGILIADGGDLDATSTTIDGSFEGVSWTSGPSEESISLVNCNILNSTWHSVAPIGDPYGTHISMVGGTCTQASESNGAIHLVGYKSAIVDGVTVQCGSSALGGGISVDVPSTGGSQAIVKNCHISGFSQGYGLLALYGTSPQFLYNEIRGCKWGVQLYQASPTIRSSTIIGNSSATAGIEMTYAGSNPTVMACVIDSFPSGAGLNIYGGSPQVTQTQIQNCKWGAHICESDGVPSFYNTSAPHNAITNCTTGIYVNCGAHPSIEDVTIASPNGGIGLYTDGTSTGVYDGLRISAGQVGVQAFSASSYDVRNCEISDYTSWGVRVSGNGRVSLFNGNNCVKGLPTSLKYVAVKTPRLSGIPDVDARGNYWCGHPSGVDLSSMFSPYVDFSNWLGTCPAYEGCSGTVSLNVGQLETLGPSLSVQSSTNAVNLIISIENTGRYRLQIYDVAGRLVRTLLDAVLAAGTTVTKWNGQDESGSPVVSGVYFARLSGDQISRARHFLLAK